MIPPDHNRSTQLARSHHLVEAEAGAVSLAVSEPADPRRKPLELDSLAREADPARNRLLVAEQVEDGVVGAVDVLGVAGDRHPAERSAAPAELRPDVGGDEARVVEGALGAVLGRQAAQGVSVVEGRRAGAPER